MNNLLTSQNLPVKGYLERLLNNKSMAQLSSTSRKTKTAFSPNLKKRRSVKRVNKLAKNVVNRQNQYKRRRMNYNNNNNINNNSIHNQVMNNLNAYHHIVLYPKLPVGRNSNYHRNMYYHLLNQYARGRNLRNFSANNLREGRNSVLEHYLFNVNV